MKKNYFVVALLLTSCASQTPDQLRQENLAYDLAYTNQYALSQEESGKAAQAFFLQPITLQQAIDFALENNLDAVISAQRVAIKREALTGSYWRMLPSLMLSGELSNQNHYVPSSSMSWQTKEQSLEPSISHDKETKTFSVEASWNLLNLAVDFQRARQAGLKVEMEEYELARVRQNLALDVTNAYLRCVVAKEAMTMAEELIGRAEQRRGVLAQEGERQTSNPQTILQEEISILELQNTMRRFKNDYRQAWQRLAKLMGVSPAISIDFAAPEVSAEIASLDIAKNLAAWEKEALGQRLEMFRLDREESEALADVDVALLQMFPALSPFARYSRDENSYLSRNDWANVGLRVSWDLLTIPRLFAEKNQGKQQARLIRKQRQAEALAVVVQLNLAVLEYEDALEGLNLARKLEDSNGKLFRIVEHGVQSRMGESETALLQSNERYLQARFNSLQAWADLLTARVRIYNSLGRDFAGQEFDLAQEIVTLEQQEKAD